MVFPLTFFFYFEIMDEKIAFSLVFQLLINKVKGFKS